MLFAFGQVLLGLRLRRLRGTGRVRLRRYHLAVMAALVAVGAPHAVLNGALVRALAGVPF